MLNTDDFVIIVDGDKPPILAEPGANLAEYTDSRYFRTNKRVALKDGRALSGSIFRSRELTASDEFEIFALLSQRFEANP